MSSSDRPIAKLEQDRLGYAGFARALAAGIVNRLNVTDGYVVGLEGKWGMGKTSAVNLVVSAIEEAQASTELAKRIIAVRLAIWPTSGADVLAKSYLKQLEAALQANFSARVGRKYKRKIASFVAKATAAVEAGTTGVAVLTGAGAPTAGVIGKLSGWVTTYVGSWFALDGVQNGSAELKSDLARIDGQLLVIIDDIDRLHPEEMRQLLTLVKTYGDLPRVTHLILYDKDIVDDALATQLGSDHSGPTYLEKIVQLSVALPALPHWRLLDLLRDQLMSSDIVVDESRLTEVWRRGLRDLLDSPRSVVRLTNALAVGWPSLANHADAIDFLCLEAIRLVEQPTWFMIRNLRYELVGRSDRMIKESFNVEAIAATGSLERQLSLRSLIEILFPIVANRPTWPDDQAELRRRRSIGSPEYVDVYFLLQPGKALGASEIAEYLLAIGNEGSLRALFVELRRSDDRERTRVVLNALADNLPIDSASLGVLLKVLLDEGDDLVSRFRAVPPTAHDQDVLQDLDALLWQCLSRIEPDVREKRLQEAIHGSRSIATPAILWQRIALRANVLPDISYSGSQEMVLGDAKSVTKMGSVIVAHLQDAFDKRRSSFGRTPLLGWVLQIWVQAGGGDGAARAARRLLNDDVSLGFILDSVMSTSFSSKGVSRSLMRAPEIPGVAASELIARAESRVGSETFLQDIGFDENRVVLRSIVETFVDLARQSGDDRSKDTA